MTREVGDTTIFPQRAVALLLVTFPDGTRIQGTGTLVGRNDILTATHVVYDPDAGGWASDIDIYPGADYNSVTDRFDLRPLAYENVTFRLEAYPTQVHSEGANETLSFEESAYDVAVIGVDIAIGDTTGWFGLDTGQDGDLRAQAFGYPGTGTGMMQAEPFVSRESDFAIYSTYGGDELMGPGSSGGPLYVIRNNQPYVIGVKSSGTVGQSNHWADIGFTYDSLILPALSRNDSLLGGSSGNAPQLSISASNSSRAEGAAGVVTTFQFEVARSGDISQPSSVQWSAGRAGTGTASADGSDFVGGAFPIGTVSFSAGEARRTFEVRVAGDGRAESDEVFVVTLLSAANGVITSGQASATIRNDDLDNDSGDTPASASALGNLATDAGLMVVERLDDEDYFRFTATQTGLLRATLEGMSDDGDLYLMDLAGRVLASSDNPGNAIETLAWSVQAGTSYLINVSPYQGAQTDYTLRLALSSGDTNDASDSQGSPTSLGSLQSGTPLTVSQLLDDPDYFRLYATASGQMRITLSDMTADGDLRIYDENNVQLGQSINADNADEAIVLDATIGRFYTLALEPYRGAVTSYRLQAQYVSGGTAPPLLGLATTTLSANEGDGGVTLTVNRLDGSSAAVPLFLRATAGSATLTSDFTLPSGTNAVLSGSQLGLRIGLVDDRALEAQEQVTIELRRDRSDGPVVGTVTLQIADNDAGGGGGGGGGGGAHAAVYRYAKLSNGMYFYTANEAERQTIATSYPDFRFEGAVFYGESQSATGLQPIYRYANLLNGGYFYTASEAERQSIAASYPHLRFEGAVFQVPAAPAGGDIVPVYRLASLVTGGYLFTASAAERSFAISLGTWRDEGIAFNAWRDAFAANGAQPASSEPWGRHADLAPVEPVSDAFLPPVRLETIEALPTDWLLL